MFSREDVNRIAKLARLHISEQEAEQYQGQLESVLSYVDQLQAVDTKGVEELQHAVKIENVFREDAPSCDTDERARAIALFSAKDGTLLEVPAVFSEGE